MASKVDPKLIDKATNQLGKMMGNKENQGSQNSVKMSDYDSGRTGNGRKKAVLIGINYFGTKAELKGCINDVRNVTRFIKERYQFTDVVILTDDNSDPSKLPTKRNMIAAFQWLVKDAQPNDSLFVHYSGHGISKFI